MRRGAALLLVALVACGPGAPGVTVTLRFARPTADARDRRAWREQLHRDNQRSLSAFLAGFPAAQLVEPLWSINGAVVNVPADAVAALSRAPGVVEVQEERTWRRRPEPAAPPTAGDWNHGATGAPELWARGQRGAGTVVAVLDTGVDAQHPDLGPRWRGGSNSWFDAWDEHATPADRDGHGTRVLGLVLGGDSRGAPLGMAPEARWIAARIFNDAGTTSTSAVHRALQWVLDPDGDPATEDAPDVVNNSWGLETRPNQCISEFDQDVQALRTAGMAVVFAAGNDGPGEATSTSPANNPAVVSVGSVDAQGDVQDSSSRGPSACGGGVFPTLVAPGVAVVTADLTLGGVFPQSFVTVSGTSFAAPHVAGALALLRGAHPGCPAAVLETSLGRSAAGPGADGPDDDQGYGHLDVDAADRWLADGPCAGARPPPPEPGAAHRGAGPGCSGAGAPSGDWLGELLLVVSARWRRAHSGKAALRKPARADPPGEPRERCRPGSCPSAWPGRARRRRPP